MTRPTGPTPPRVVAVAAGLLAAGALSTATLAAGGAPAYAVALPCDGIDADTPTTDDVEAPGAPVEALQVAEAQDAVRRLSGLEPGEGVTVAVIDSGVVDDDAAISVPQHFSTGTAVSPDLEYWHGTAVAGIVAGRPLADVGPVGIAPAARVLDVRVFDVGPDSTEEDLGEVTANALVDGLELIEDRVGPRPGGIDVVLLAEAVPDDTPELLAAVRDVVERGGIVVTASGNRPGEGQPFADELGTYRPGEDAADFVFPAGYSGEPGVLVVGTTPPPGVAATDVALQSSAIDVAAPSAGVVSYALNGSTCTLDVASTSMASAEVAGVVALLRTVYPTDTPEQTISRLEETAAGAAVEDPDNPDKLLGRGIVQPVEALTRPLVVGRDGTVDRTSIPTGREAPSALPVPAPDLLADTRRDAVWWGLGGGGALVVALLLRPVLARRRR